MRQGSRCEEWPQVHPLQDGQPRRHPAANRGSSGRQYGQTESRGGRRSPAGAGLTAFATRPSLSDPERKPFRSMATNRNPIFLNSRSSVSRTAGSNARAISPCSSSSRATSPWYRTRAMAKPIEWSSFSPSETRLIPSGVISVPYGKRDDKMPRAYKRRHRERRLAILVGHRRRGRRQRED